MRAASSLLALWFSALGCAAAAPQGVAPVAAPSAAPAELAEPVTAPPAAPPASASGLPDTPVGRQLGAWLEAFGSQQKAALLAFHERHFPYAAAIGDLRDIEREHGLSVGTGGFEVRRVEKSESTSLVVLLKERNSPQHARVQLDPAEEAGSRRVRRARRRVRSGPSAS